MKPNHFSSLTSYFSLSLSRFIYFLSSICKVFRCDFNSIWERAVIDVAAVIGIALPPSLRTSTVGFSFLWKIKKFWFYYNLKWVYFYWRFQWNAFSWKWQRDARGNRFNNVVPGKLVSLSVLFYLFFCNTNTPMPINIVIHARNSPIST